MQDVGVIDEAGRMRLLGSAVAGAAFATVLVVLIVSSWLAVTPGLLVSVGLPSAVAGAAVAVVVQLRSWGSDGGYERVVLVERWITEREIPLGVPAEMWVPMLQAQAGRLEAGWGKVVMSVFWIPMTWSMRDQHGTLLTLLLIGLWVGLGGWSAVWVIPRARTARSMLRQGVATRD
ncbi:hypothetical protein [Curtobacterium sp. ISL-83]|uniref:hypothetical protein n=1 Tax=Curtobacterium sp. ISL-83 TaxID=2819145 RepID=UPI001BEBA8A5|nr:hypothetical protein [Curtobacterium sp. ISL-83]MBT2501042.1 hypothetical protein [Curtobacterium sp. ISL-83]